MVSPEELAPAYTLGGLQMDLSGIVGPLLGGLLIPLVGDRRTGVPLPRKYRARALEREPASASRDAAITQKNLAHLS
jgi:hypothetical protein